MLLFSHFEMRGNKLFNCDKNTVLINIWQKTTENLLPMTKTQETEFKKFRISLKRQENGDEEEY